MWARENVYDDLVQAASDATGVPVEHIKATIAVESAFNPAAVSPPNANGTRDYGLMQLNGANLPGWGMTPADALDPAHNIQQGAQLLAANYARAGDWDIAHAAYNSGWSTQRAGDAPRRADGSLVSADYVARINNALAYFQSLNAPPVASDDGSVAPDASGLGTGVSGLLIIGVAVGALLLFLRGRHG